MCERESVLLGGGWWGLDFQESVFTMAALDVRRLPMKQQRNTQKTLKNEADVGCY